VEEAKENWFFEKHRGTKIGFKIKKTLYSRSSRYQEIKILDTFDWGRVLVLDNTVMLTEKDEFFYHEIITHLPIFLLDKIPEKVLVLGGGDGGSVRELLKYPEVKQIKLVEIDQDVIKASREFLPFTSCRLDDEKLEVIIQDADIFLEEYLNKNYSLERNKFDLIISDSSDPVGFAKVFVQESFYQKIDKVLKKEGLLVQQSSSALLQKAEFDLTRTNLRKVFPKVGYAWSLVPTYPGGLWTFSFASKEHDFDEKRNFAKKESFLSKEELAECRFWKPDLAEALLAKPKILDL